VVHTVVKNAGGSIEVHSTPERGTTFVIDLPIHQPSLMLDLDDTTTSRSATSGDEA
jgi:K+-sensing histidine kinase KdpD